MMNLNINPNEQEINYIMRLGQAKDNGEIDMTWAELSDVMNNNLRKDSPYTESAYRKKYTNMKQYKEFSMDKNDSDDLVELRRELEKERIKLRDERTEYRRLIREEARKESYEEQFIHAITDHVTAYPVIVNNDYMHHTKGETAIVVSLTDIHTGIEIQNKWNIYNTDILGRLFEYYLFEIFEIAERHNANEVVIIASEAISGLIHPSIRLQNNQDIIEQFLTVSDYICEFLAKLSEKFSVVRFYVAPGNHGRINAKKEDGLAHENMDNLLVPFMDAKMQLYKNVFCYGNTIPDIVQASVLGHRLVAVHGDKDSMNTVTKNMTKLLGYTPDVIVMGHLHYNAMTTDGYTKVIQSGSFCGPDEYATDKRLVGRKEQTVLVMSEKGLVCTYDVGFEGII